MNTFLITLLLALAFFALIMLGLGIKMVVKKHGEFKRHCSSMDPYTGKDSGCVCGKAAQKQCGKAERYSPLEVNENMLN